MNRFLLARNSQRTLSDKIQFVVSRTPDVKMIFTCSLLHFFHIMFAGAQKWGMQFMQFIGAPPGGALVGAPFC